MKLSADNYLRSCAVVILIVSLHGAAGAIGFEDTTSEAGIDRRVQTFGISWSDYDGDGRPDVYLSNHWFPPTLYRNDGLSGFVDVTAQHGLMDGHVDEHGAAFGDYDGDGDPDLIVLTGGTTEDGDRPFTSLFTNEFGTFGYTDPLATGLTYGYSDRTPIWIDENLDGLLDVIIANATGKHPDNASALFRQTAPGQFEEVLQFTDAGIFACLMPNPGNGAPDLAFANGLYFRQTGGSWSDVSDEVFPATGPRSGTECAVGDVNGDGAMDLYLIREGLLTQFRQTDNQVQAAYQSVPEQIAGFDFAGGDTLTVYFGLSLNRSRMRLGAGLAEPPGTGVFSDPIIVSKTDPEVLGEPEMLIDSNKVTLWIWYTPGDDTWHFRTANLDLKRQIEMEIVADTPLQAASLVNIELAAGGQRNELYLGDGSGGLAAASPQNGISYRSQSRAGAFADFDNDMDLDLYIVNRNRFDNLPNQLFENNGDGTFVEVPDAGGAAGSPDGSGQSVAIADYDLDGFLDFFLANGRSDLLLPDYPGPHELFRNIGNTNHWLQIDLIGTTSARDAVGAVVEVSAGGISQLRFQDGGMHAYSQNMPRLHFGLGDNLQADSVTIRWPGGIVQHLGPVTADQVVAVTEPADTDQDSVPDAADNCTTVANPAQCDTNGDGFGNYCDPDLDNDGVVNFSDLTILATAFFATSEDPGYDPDADLDCNGAINFLDLDIVSDRFFGSPGPAGTIDSP